MKSRSGGSDSRLVGVAVVLAAIGHALSAEAAPAATSQSTSICAGQTLDPEALQRALDTVVDAVRSAHVDRDAAAHRAALEALARIPTRTPRRAFEFGRDVNEALGRARDAHLRLELSPAVAVGCERLPLSLVWTDDGLLVTAGALPRGSRILAVGGRSLASLAKHAETVVPHENPYFARHVLARDLPRHDVLAAAGALALDGTVTVRYAVPSGEERTTALRPASMPPAESPAVEYRMDVGASVGVLTLRRFTPGEQFDSTLRRFVSEARDLGLRAAAIDLRGSAGGDSGLALAVLEALGAPPRSGFAVHVRVSERLLDSMPMFAPATIGAAFEAAEVPPPPPDAAGYDVPPSLVLDLLAQRQGQSAVRPYPVSRLYLLVDGGTFSTATLLAVLARDNASAVLVGEPTGNSASFNGNEVEIAVPDAPYVLHVSTAALERPDRGAGPAPTVLPDVRAPMTAAALAAGVDPAVEWVTAAVTRP